jgi:hypothetical protein
MLRTITVTLAATIAVALAACGSGAATSNVTPERAKTNVERAAQLKLTPQPIPDDAREQGLQAAYSNTATAVKDKQLVALFVMNDAGVADKVSDMVRSSAPKSARLIINDTVIVVYAAAGSDHATAVEHAINAL